MRDLGELQKVTHYRAPSFADERPVIRIGHGSTVPPMVIMFAVGRGCTTSKWWGAVSFQTTVAQLKPPSGEGATGQRCSLRNPLSWWYGFPSYYFLYYIVGS